MQDLNHVIINSGNGPHYDTYTNLTETDTLYLQQNGISGYFFFGGEKSNAKSAINADDSKISSVSFSYLQRKLTQFFGQENEEKNCLISEWKYLARWGRRMDC